MNPGRSQITLSVTQWEVVERLHRSALALPEPERALFLKNACGADEELRCAVEALLASGEEAATLADQCPAETGPGEVFPPGTLVGSYVVLRPVGKGGMGEVVAARDERLQRTVALKFLPDGLAGDQEALERFRREARAASALNHPNICTIHDVGEHRGRPYIVMELLDGESLKDRIANGPLPVDEVLTIGAQIADALASAHARGIVHRDVKPANLFVTAHGEAKVLDFGLAMLTAEPDDVTGAAPTPAAPVSHPGGGLTTPGSRMGTISYMSPEQARGNALDARTDVFSFGVVLFEMATGTRPFLGADAAEVLNAITTAAPPRPSALRPDLPAALDHVILRALEKDPAARFQSTAEIREALTDLQRTRTLKTRRWVLGGLGATAAALVVGTYFGRRLIFSPGRVMVAVLPLEDLGKDPEQAYFAAGLHDEMISVLGRLYPDRLGVIGSSSVRQYTGARKRIGEIGRDLNVTYVVDGSVRREGNRVRVSAQLIRVQDRSQVWAETYDRDLSQILAVQSDVAQAVAQGIERTLKPSAHVRLALARPVNPEAYEAFLRGENAKAIELDPNYAPAHAGLARDFYYRGLFGASAPKELFENVRRSASRAVELDPTLADAWASLALARLHSQWDWRGAEADFRHAIRLDPSDAHVRHDFAHFLLCMNRGRESAEECRQAVELDPFDSLAIGCFGWHELMAGRFARAVEESRRALALDASNGWASVVMGWAYEQLGRYQEALSALKAAKGLLTLQTAAIAHVFARSGNRAAAETLLADLLEKSRTIYVSAFDIAAVYGGLDRVDQTFTWLGKAFEERSGFMPYMNLDPRFAPLHADRRYQDLLGRMGLSPVV